MSSNYSAEFNQVQLPALIHLARLGYQYLDKDQRKELGLDEKTNILTHVLKERYFALNKPQLHAHEVNSTKVEEAANQAAEYQLTEEDFQAEYAKIIQSMSYEDLGRDFFNNLKRFVDLENPENNQWHYTAELTYQGKAKSLRSDITLFINGLPLVLIELKRQHNLNGLHAEKDRMELERIADEGLRRFMNITQLMIFSNNMEYDAQPSLMHGSFYCTGAHGNFRFNRFREDTPAFINNYRYLPDNPNLLGQLLKGRQSLQVGNDELAKISSVQTPTNRFLTSLCSQQRLLFILKYGITYVEQTKTVDGKQIAIFEKHIIRYQQLLACEAVLKALDEKRSSGIIWHTQGSGKTALTYFLTKVLSNYFARQNIVTKFYFVVDRLDLLNQAQEEFSKRGLNVVTASNRKEFIKQLNNSSAVEGNKHAEQITVINIQRFSDGKGKQTIDFNNSQYGNLQRIFIVDEAHRSYAPQGKYLTNLLNSDPNSIRLALTGTPLIGDDFNTKKIFQDYIHIYHQSQSVQDGYTLKLKFDSNKMVISGVEQLDPRLDRIKVKNREVPYRCISESKQYALTLIKEVLRDLDNFRFMRSDPSIGGMLICKSRAQAVKVQQMFDTALAQLQAEKPDFPNLRMGLVVSKEDEHGIEKTNLNDQHRKVISEFKRNENSSIDLLVVYQMLITGFDAPRLKRLYVNRELNGHTLLQAITRVNRPYKDTPYGHVVDFVGIFDNYQQTQQLYRQELQDFINKINTTQADQTTAVQVSDYLLTEAEQEQVVAHAQEILNSHSISISNSWNEFNHLISQIDSLQAISDISRALQILNEDPSLSQEEHDRIREFIKTTQNHRTNLRIMRDKREDGVNVAALIAQALESFSFAVVKQSENLDLDMERKQAQAFRELQRRVMDKTLFPLIVEEQANLTLLEAIRLRLQQNQIIDLDSPEGQELYQQINEFNQVATQVEQEIAVIKNHYDGDAKYLSLYRQLNLGTFPTFAQEDWTKNPEILGKVVHRLEDKVENMVDQRREILENKERFLNDVRGICSRELHLDDLAIRLNREQRNSIAEFLYQQYTS